MLMGLGGSNRNDDSDDDEEQEGISPEQETLDEQPTEEPESPTEPDGETTDSTPSGGGGAVIAGGATPTGDDPNGGEADTEPEEDVTDSDSTDPDQDTHDQSETEEEEVEEETQEVELVVYTDAWDSVGWGIEPVIRRLEKEFGLNFDLSYEALAPRELDAEERAVWQRSCERYEMPIDLSVWAKNTSETTEFSNRALYVAQEQDQFVEYLRRLRIATLVEGRDIEDYRTLLNLAREVGLDLERFKVDWEEADVSEVTDYEKTPMMVATVGDITVQWSGNLEYEHAFGVLLNEDVIPVSLPISLKEYLDRYSPTPTEELAFVFNKGVDETASELREKDEIQEIAYGGCPFWTLQEG